MGFNEQIEPNKERNGYANEKEEHYHSLFSLLYVYFCLLCSLIGFNIAGFSYGGMFGETGIKKGHRLSRRFSYNFQLIQTLRPNDQMRVVESIFQTRLMRDIQKHVSQGEGGNYC